VVKGALRHDGPLAVVLSTTVKDDSLSSCCRLPKNWSARRPWGTAMTISFQIHAHVQERRREIAEIEAAITYVTTAGQKK